MAHTSENTSGFKAFTATAAAIGLGVRVKLDSSGTISAAGVTDEWIGTATSVIPASGTGNIRLRNSPGSHMFVAAGAITKGAKLYPAANGKVDDATGTGVFIGFQAAETVGADGDIFEGVPSDPLDFTSSAAQAALTDNTGGSGSADDTLADGLTVTAITDNSGGAAANGTIEAITTFTPTVAWDGSAVYPSAADATAIAAAITALMAAVAELAAKINTIVTDLGVQNQNDSDMAAKINAHRTALINAGIIAGS